MEKNQISITIKEGIFSIQASDSGKHPVLVPVEGIRLFVNDTLLKEAQPVGPDDKITWESEEKMIQEGTADIQIASDQMSASLTLQKKRSICYQLEDQTGDGEIFEPKVTKQFVFDSICTREELDALLKTSGLAHGIDQEAVQKAYERMDGRPVDIATGTPPQPGRDALLTVHFKQENNLHDKTSDELQINYREKGSIPCVAKDELLLSKKPASFGIEGLNVKAKKLPADKVNDFSLKAGKNTYLSSDELTLYSAVLGHPHLEKSNRTVKASVLPTYSIHQDINMKTGNLHFDGGIKVMGSVSENMEITAGQDITITKDVTDAHIVTEGSVYIQDNVINTVILAGAQQSYHFQTLPYLQEFTRVLVSLLKGYRQIKEKRQKKTPRFGYVLDRLIENKYPDFPKQLHRLEKNLHPPKGVVLAKEMTGTISALQEKLTAFSRVAYQNPESAISLLESLEKLAHHFHDTEQDRSQVQVPYCLNSDIEASGDIIVDGQGSFHTRLRAHGSIHVKGIVRGGQITADNSVSIHEVGSEASVSTHIAVPYDQQVTLGHVYENTHVKIGSHVHRFQEPCTQVRLAYDKKENRLRQITFR